jgi:hypothetical protein
LTPAASQVQLSTARSALPQLQMSCGSLAATPAWTKPTALPLAAAAPARAAGLEVPPEAQPAAEAAAPSADPEAAPQAPASAARAAGPAAAAALAGSQWPLTPPAPVLSAVTSCQIVYVDAVGAGEGGQEEGLQASPLAAGAAEAAAAAAAAAVGAERGAGPAQIQINSLPRKDGQHQQARQDLRQQQLQQQEEEDKEEGRETATRDEQRQQDGGQEVAEQVAAQEGQQQHHKEEDKEEDEEEWALRQQALEAGQRKRPRTPAGIQQAVDSLPAARRLRLAASAPAAVPQVTWQHAAVPHAADEGSSDEEGAVLAALRAALQRRQAQRSQLPCQASSQPVLAAVAVRRPSSKQRLRKEAGEMLEAEEARQQQRRQEEKQQRRRRQQQQQQRCPEVQKTVAEAKDQKAQRQEEAEQRRRPRMEAGSPLPGVAPSSQWMQPPAPGEPASPKAAARQAQPEEGCEDEAAVLAALRAALQRQQARGQQVPLDILPSQARAAGVHAAAAAQPLAVHSMVSGGKGREAPAGKQRRRQQQEAAGLQAYRQPEGDKEGEQEVRSTQAQPEVPAAEAPRRPGNRTLSTAKQGKRRRTSASVPGSAAPASAAIVAAQRLALHVAFKHVGRKALRAARFGGA